ncbi:exodeoxyribonuclease III [Microvirga sp. W0021]|uniref:Exodeoxyribonuclease III n=1 Tax=Hohaiivirga grylli TaxID=3133970 RepID=A0ABV0BME2_9HYPH
MKIVSWNVNSIRQRLEHLINFLDKEKPDVVCLQELKCQDDGFPRLEIEGAGYNVAFHGQKAFNGVAILSRHPINDIRKGLPGDETDEQSRYIEAVITPVDQQAFRVASIYLPNGNPLGTPKFDYKLAWMKRLKDHVQSLLPYEEPLVLAGDYNIIPEEKDAANPQEWVNDALFQPESRAAFRAILNLGLTEALRACYANDKLYTFWDYQAGAWQRNNGIRIDHLLLSPQAADKLQDVVIYKETRDWEKPSDHVPIIGIFS